MTGQDPVTARLLYAEFFTFVPTFKIMLAANHKPTVRGTDLGIWRRIHLVPWEVTVPEVDVDPDLPSKVNGEASGILNWAIEGFREWRRIGLQAPAAVQAATAEYRAEQDPLAEFLEACVIVDEGGEVKAERVYEAYTNWAMRVGVRFPMKQKTLGLQLQDLGFRPWKGTGGVRFWRGLRLKV